ncbi:alpha/beta hydrolase [Rhodococcus sp. NBC_00297]|uniref:alpha/beta hydrolase n=1 Tax=Rhodococcus sp. NBC_00297 TaxID=2976005 RepID=UPI002E2B06B3|nr:alpha/beta hydrolase [Rhodococcus sp. NBC_00297]
MSSRRASVRLAVSLSVLAVLAAACGSDVGGTPTDDEGGSVPVTTTETRADQPSTLDAFRAQRVTWGSCEGFVTDGSELDPSLQCGRVTVPIDYDDPAGPTASLALSRSAATGEKVGSMLVNPGGPGASGLSTATVARGTAVESSFDVIGFDPRGIGASVPAVRCDTPREFDAERADNDVDTSPAGITETEKENQDYAARCAERNDPVLLEHLTSADVARDMDVVRSVLGDDQLTYLGFSYGTRLGYTYAELFPENVRAMVLDGALDPAANAADEVVAQGAGFQSVFDAFAADCAGRSDCPLGTDPAGDVGSFRALVDPLVDRPASTELTGPEGARSLSYDDAVTGVQQALYSTELWGPLRRGLTQLENGQGDILLSLADLYNGRLSDGTYSNTNDAFTAVRCVDDPRVTDRAEEGALDARFRAAAPFLDDGRGNGTAPLEPCAFWPVPSAADPGPVSIPGLAPTVVVSTTDDPATPYEAGVALAAQLGSSLITYEGNQHTASFAGIACIDDAVSAYLVDLTPPPAGLRC